jgi:hypothetical protein
MIPEGSSAQPRRLLPNLCGRRCRGDPGSAGVVRKQGEETISGQHTLDTGYSSWPEYKTSIGTIGKLFGKASASTPEHVTENQNIPA